MARAIESPGAAPPGEAPSAPQVFHRGLREYLSQLPGVSQRFWILVVATGVVSGLGAVALLEILSFASALAWGRAPTLLEGFLRASPARRVLVPALGGLLVTLAMLAYRRRLGGHGTAGIIEAVWVHEGRLPLGRALFRGVVSVVSVGLGASLGREGALVQTGAAAGSWLADRFGVTRGQARLLVVCGAASGIAAAYNVPIGGALFGLEVLLGSFALELFGPVVVSCVTATLIARAVAGDQPSYLIPEYQLMQPTELLAGAVLAPFIGAASALFVKVMGWVEVQLYRVPPGPARLLPPVGGLLVGLAALRWPQLLGNGYDTVKAALLGGVPLSLLLTLPFLKLAAAALCAGVGIPGGLFTPSLFFGALLGGGLGQLLQHAFPVLTAPPGAYALVGMAGALAGTTHAAVSAVIMAFELTGDYGVVLPLMLSATLAAATSRALERDSLYTAPLRRRGVRLPELPRPEWLKATPVATLLSPAAARCPPQAKFQDVVLELLALPAGQDLYVTAPDGRLLGTIALERLKGAIPDQALLSMIVAADVMDRSAVPLEASMTVAQAAARLAETEAERLPVVDDHRRLVGTIAKTDLLRRGRF